MANRLFRTCLSFEPPSRNPDCRRFALEEPDNNALHRSSVPALRRFGDDRFAIVSSPSRLRSAPLPGERWRSPTDIDALDL